MGEFRVLFQNCLWLFIIGGALGVLIEVYGGVIATVSGRRTQRFFGRHCAPFTGSAVPDAMWVRFCSENKALLFSF